MRALLHLLSIALVLPAFVLALAFVILGRAIAAGSLWGLFDRLLSDALWLVPWGILGICVAWLAIAIGGLFARTQWLAGLCVAIIAIVSTAILLLLTIGHSNAAVAHLPFYIPGLVAAGIGGWLAHTGRPRQPPTPIRARAGG